MALVAGIDSSTQSCKVVVCDADTGETVRAGSEPHPGGTEVDPAQWWSALQAAIAAAGGLDDVAAVSVGAQQHGMICLDASGTVVRDALLWNDTRSSGAAADLVAELGGPGEWAKRVGVVPVASITAAKLRWLADVEPRNADATAAVCLPHDWLTWRLAGGTDIADLRTDRSDASGTGYFAAEDSEYHPDLLMLALRGRDPHLPTVLGPNGARGRPPPARSSAGAGDNAAAALGIGAGPGDCVVSLGTSGVVSAVGDAAHTTRRVWSRGSRMRRGGNCRWSARSTVHPCWPRSRRCWVSTSTNSTGSRCLRPPVPRASCWCLTSMANDRPICRTPRARSTG